MRGAVPSWSPLAACRPPTETRPAAAARRRYAAALLLAALLPWIACGTPEETVVEAAPAYTQPVPDYAHREAQRTPPAVTFTDVTAAAGIDFTHETGAFGAKWMPETMGAGAGFFDADGDGDDDVLLVNGSWWAGHVGSGPPPTSALYANDGAGRFVDRTAGSGLDVSVYGMGITAADYDADGDTDLYLTTLGANRLLRQDDVLRYTEVAGPAGVAGTPWTDDDGRAHPEWATGALWADVDNDGWPDLFVTHYVRWSPEHDLYASFDGKDKSYATPQQYPGSTPRLYRNDRGRRFEEVTEKAGLWLPEAKSMSAAAGDLDGDGWVDLVVTNDTQPNYLLRNTGGGRFEEIGLAAGIGYDDAGRARAGMGVDIAVLDAAGTQAIGIGNFSREALSLYTQTRPGAAVFVDGAGRSRLVQATLPALTFGLRFFDYDLDGHQDLMLANGHIEPGINGVQKEITYAQLPQLFWNDGEGRMLDADAGAAFSPLVARGLAVGDLEGDGDPDVLLSTNGGPAHLLRNGAAGGAGGAALTLRLRGRAPNVDALGATVTVQTAAGQQQLRVRTGASYLSHSSTRLVFGLGAEGAAVVRVRWPDGSVQELGSLPAGAYTVDMGRPAYPTP